MEAEEADVTAREGGGYAWEEKYKRSWDLVQEDAYGSLQAVISSLQQQLLKKKRYSCRSMLQLVKSMKYI
jgi:transcription initiation factor TFIIH subunit 2